MQRGTLLSPGTRASAFQIMVLKVYEVVEDSHAQRHHVPPTGSPRVFFKTAGPGGLRPTLLKHDVILI